MKGERREGKKRREESWMTEGRRNRGGGERSEAHRTQRKRKRGNSPTGLKKKAKSAAPVLPGDTSKCQRDYSPSRPPAPLLLPHSCPSSLFPSLSLHLPGGARERIGKHLALGETYVFVTSLRSPARLQQNAAAVYLDVEGDSFTQI